MGKSTTINLLTYAGCSGMSINLLFSRVKIREIENKIKELYEMMTWFYSFYSENLGEWKRLSHALEILNSIKTTITQYSS